MSDFVIARVLTAPNGTVVKEVDSDGNLTGRTFWTFNWNARPQTRSEGCPQWIYQVVVGDSPDGAQSATALIPNDTSVASSSASSRDLVVLHVDGDGKPVEFFTVGYGLVPRFLNSPVPKGQLPIAAELWLCNQPFNPKTTSVVGLEQQCEDEAAANARQDSPGPQS
jgi:hypothetical protein